jgi:hypothetical protein
MALALAAAAACGCGGGAAPPRSSDASAPAAGGDADADAGRTTAAADAGPRGPDAAAADRATPDASAPAASDVAPSRADADGPADAGARPAEAGVAASQVPPRGRQALEAWLAEGHHRRWRCEPTISARRLNGAHGRTRICSNDALLASKSGDYPPGAASVKELYTSSDGPNGFAVSLKIASGSGPGTWYWFERLGGSVFGDGDGTQATLCSGCHAGAPRDHVFFRAGE